MTLKSPISQKIGTEADPFATQREGAIQLRTNDGFAVSAKKGFTTRYTHSMDLSGRATTSVVWLNDWTITSESIRPLLWVSRVDNWEDIEGFGNLQLRSHSSFSLGHYVLTGRNSSYYLIKVESAEQKEVYLGVHRRDGETPTHLELHRNVKYLGVTFGQSMQIGPLVGVDEHLQFAAALGDTFGSSGRANIYESPPVPLHEHRVCHAAGFFSKLSNYAIDESGSYFTAAAHSYLDSINDVTYDGEEFKVLQGLLYISREILGFKGALLLNRDMFRSWVAAQSGSLAEFVAIPEALDLTSVGDFVVTPSGLGLVVAAIEQSGLKVIQFIRDALEQANDGLQGQLHPPAPAARRERIAVLRTVLSALISKSIGYSGPITGWVKEEPYYFYQREFTDWWDSIADDSLASVFHRAEYAARATTVGEVWPLFAELQMPSSSLGNEVVAFANALEAKTSSQVVARVVPVVLDADAHSEVSRAFDLVMFGKTQRLSRVVLFSFREGTSGALTIEGWHDSEVVIDHVDLLRRFLEEVAASPATKSHVHRFQVNAALERA